MVGLRCWRERIAQDAASLPRLNRLTVRVLCAVMVVVFSGIVGGAPLPQDYDKIPQPLPGLGKRGFGVDDMHYDRSGHPLPPRFPPPPGQTNPPRDRYGDVGLKPTIDPRAAWNSEIHPSQPGNRMPWIENNRAATSQYSHTQDGHNDEGFQAASVDKMQNQPPAPESAHPAEDWGLFLSAQF